MKSYKDFVGEVLVVLSAATPFSVCQTLSENQSPDPLFI